MVCDVKKDVNVYLMLVHFHASPIGVFSRCNVLAVAASFFHTAVRFQDSIFRVYLPILCLTVNIGSFIGLAKESAQQTVEVDQYGLIPLWRFESGE